MGIDNFGITNVGSAREVSGETVTLLPGQSKDIGAGVQFTAGITRKRMKTNEER